MPVPYCCFASFALLLVTCLFEQGQTVIAQRLPHWLIAFLVFPFSLYSYWHLHSLECLSCFSLVPSNLTLT